MGKDIITIDEAIEHFEAIGAMAKSNGIDNPTHIQLAKYLRRLKRYEDCLASGELVWADSTNGMNAPQSSTPPPEESKTKKAKKTTKEKTK